MDIALNISSTPVVKKSTTTNNALTKKQKQIAASAPSFEFKWDSNRKTAKPAYVNKNAIQNRTKIKPKIFQNKSVAKPVKDKPVIDIDDYNEYTEVPEHEVQKPKKIIEGNKKVQKVYTIFNKFSEAAQGHAYENIKGKSAVENVFSSTGSTFKDLNIHPHTVTNLERINQTTLTAVQEKAIPEALKGKNVFVRSQTGSGKTLAYAIPVVEGLRSIEPHINRKDGIKAVIVVPTRELALQTYELFLKLVEPFRWIVPGRLCGGENRNSEKARLRKGISILIGTPGRLLDHALHTQNLMLDKVKCLVLDEADRLLDMGFQKDVLKLVEIIDSSSNSEYDPIALMKSRGKKIIFDDEQNNAGAFRNKDRQTILLSATLTSNVKDLASFTMKDFIYIDPLNSDPNVDINSLPEQADCAAAVVPESVKQMFVVTDVKTRLVVLSAFIVSKAQESNCKIFVFMASKQMVEYHELLFKKCLKNRPTKEGKFGNIMISMDEDDTDSDEEEEQVLDLEFFKLHGSMDQKERVSVFKAFRAVKKGVLLCTDVAARGVDIPHADYVVQYSGPLQDEDYIHRVGRTGRAGKKGLGLLFVTETEIDYIEHLREKELFLMREQQDNILKHLLPFMTHASPSSVQSAAEILQKRFEKAVSSDKKLHKAACFAYSTWSRYYSSYPVVLKQYFDIKKAHLGHYVTSFALKDAPQQVGKFVRNEIGKTEEKRLNKKLDNYENEKPVVAKPLRVKKRPRSEELLISEYDSGLAPKKKKSK